MTSATAPFAARARLRMRSPSSWGLDVTLALVTFLLGVVSTGAAHVNGVAYEPRGFTAYTFIVLSTLPMAVRSRYPIAVLGVTSTAVALMSAADYNIGALPVCLLLTAATVGSRHDFRKVGAAAAYVFGLLVFLLAVQHNRDFTFWTFLVQLALFSTAFTVGTSLRSRRLRMDALEERAVALEATRAEEAKRAVADERLHIAQELHDVLAHTLSVIAVQAGTGAHVIDTNPDEARQALLNIADTSRASLGELRQLLGVLRTGETAAYVPAPQLSDLDRLAAEVTSAGVPVRITVDGSPAGLSAGVELVAYRIVQEALTNVLKHAGPASADVRLSFDAEGVDIEVVDDGRGLAARSGATTGHGLVGMRERVSMYGGTLRTTPGPGGGFRVRARLPVCERSS